MVNYVGIISNLFSIFEWLSEYYIDTSNNPTYKTTMHLWDHVCALFFGFSAFHLFVVPPRIFQFRTGVSNHNLCKVDVALRLGTFRFRSGFGLRISNPRCPDPVKVPRSYTRNTSCDRQEGGHTLTAAEVDHHRSNFLNSSIF